MKDRSKEWRVCTYIVHTYVGTLCSTVLPIQSITMGWIYHFCCSSQLLDAMCKEDQHRYPTFLMLVGILCITHIRFDSLAYEI
ncbi:uncharacterized protein B0J16DRAFT_337645 [Fusarium flagelliforme]|uniref:uncharacterized protein n=1 Tax=Fusarium flagelliforme TaxID=2675880 RepID=UPI001E8D103C|nr:uncharacterized protein B0J16DRAFT_337645 [Fusarium flagelliforme]KAH7188626.1 hypothetical protein B0J16DRAFT_337645 [Fusarium flagelliforme]